MIGRVRLAVIADAHVAAAGAPAQRWHNDFALAESERLLARALASAQRLRPDAIAVLGDVTNSPDRALLSGPLQALAGVENTDLRIVSGNEDPPALGSLAPVGSRASLDGELRADWLRLAGVDVVSGDGGLTGSASSPPPPDRWGDDTVVLLSHYPLLSRASDFAAKGLRYAGDLRDRVEWSEALLVRSAPTIVLSGHLHARDATSSGHVLQLNVGALIEPPHELTRVEFEPGNGYPRVLRRTYRLGRARPASDPALVPRSEEWAFDGDGWQRLPTVPEPLDQLLGVT